MLYNNTVDDTEFKFGQIYSPTCLFASRGHEDEDPLKCIMVSPDGEPRSVTCWVDAITLPDYWKAFLMRHVVCSLGIL